MLKKILHLVAQKGICGIALPGLLRRPGFLGLVVAISLLPMVNTCGLTPLLTDAKVWPEHITPNADGSTDVAVINYRLNRNAWVSIYFIDESGQPHYFRREKRRSIGEYTVYFGGVVQGRMLPDGNYTWVIEATDDYGRTEKAQGTLLITDADTTPPELRNFSVYPSEFTPNQDGLDDRVTILYYLTKPAETHVYLIDPEGRRYPLVEKERDVKPGEPGIHLYDYEGGVDLGAEPPPDGTYLVVAEAQDKVGNRTVVTATLVIKEGGVPRADILNADVQFYPKIVPLGATLYFTLTVENFGAVPIRTSGPPPGTIYKSTQNFNTLGWYEEPGVWRVGIDFETNSSGRPYPFRWAVCGDDCEVRVINGREYRFLMPGQRSTVTGGIRIVHKPPRNPIHFWAGLIHEDVRIEPFNDHVDPQEISIGF
ncbi:MAG: hypothetical protein DRI61_13840 [Chloroflexi bacterium]|nr:MAG: hypothetical protein DRI61_13840 [Chloroflexota bacterium]HDN79498.1 hypothetical protein [Chloroflexota bacterium]